MQIAIVRAAQHRAGMTQIFNEVDAATFAAIDVSFDISYAGIVAA